MKASATAAPGLLLIFLIAVGALATFLPTTPTVIPASAPPSQFSAERAFRHIQTIAREPHPIGTPANQRVRDYILSELNTLGLAPQVQATTAVFPKFAVAGQVENIAARLTGTGGSKAILLVSHYDSVHSGPGANDDASAVATLLETARALKATPPLENDVIFLFTDGEEVGLIGAAGFASQHPWMEGVGLVLNFEARGNAGPVILFETSPENGWLIGEVAKATRYPATNSFTYEVYRNLPNDTDFTVFKNAGLPGLNFGYLDGINYYHMPTDSPENLSLESLQHDGAYALDLTRHFGYLDLSNPRRANAIYFDLFGRALVHYPAAWALPLAAFSVLAYAGVAVLGLRRRQVTLAGMLWGILAFLLNTLLVAALTWVVWMLVSKLNPEYRPLGEYYNGLLYWLGFAALAVALTAAVQVILRRKLAAANLAMGALLLWVVLTVATSASLPGTSYIFTWPLLFSLAGLALLFTQQADANPLLRAAILGLTAIPALLLAFPLAYAIYLGLTIEMILVPMVVLALVLGLLVPHLEMITRPYRWALPALAAVAALVIFVAASRTDGFSPERPRPNAITYGLDAGTGEARWMGFANPDEWTRQFLPPGQASTRDVSAFFPENRGGLPASPAPLIDLPAPEVEVLSDSASGDTRTINLRVRSPRGANAVYLYLNPEASVRSVSLAREQIAGADWGPDLAGNGFSWSLDFWAPPPEGFDLSLEVGAGAPLSLTLVDHSFGLPELPGFTYPPRPAWMMMDRRPVSDSVLVSASYTLNAK